MINLQAGRHLAKIETEELVQFLAIEAAKLQLRATVMMIKIMIVIRNVELLGLLFAWDRRASGRGEGID